MTYVKLWFDLIIFCLFLNYVDYKPFVKSVRRFHVIKLKCYRLVLTHYEYTFIWKKITMIALHEKSTLITVVSHERHGVLNHCQLDCLVNSLLASAQKESIKVTHYWFFVMRTTGNLWFLLTKGQ